ncbi:hypothetical protein [Ramlibacter alkalitolerans]|uniref:Uncharacterized protein n=1 Tax=Ramlibacter alkalitolerans TaxID=2039631 RepID=A0ABS1JUK5_9BURK|nr:hypothetical protein [Ramlibacter alkalitolerans]MBL0427944.1 hypothetical protein [Ramlibacter alkalitolerans]
MSKISSQVAALRTQIAELQRERDALQRQRRSRAEVAAAVDQQIKEWAERGRGAFARAVVQLSEGLAASPVVLRTTGGADGVAHADLGPFLVACVGEVKVREAYLASLADMPEGLPRAARDTRLREIASRLDDLELQEEELVERSETSGDPIARRPDARPEVVLGAPPANGPSRRGPVREEREPQRIESPYLAEMARRRYE